MVAFHEQFIRLKCELEKREGSNFQFCRDEIGQTRTNVSKFRQYLSRLLEQWFAEHFRKDE